MRRHWRAIVALLIVLVVGGAIAGYVWLIDLADPMPEATAALASDEAVTVTNEPWLTFMPADRADTGFIFYPGARVPVDAYAPPLHAIAAAGYLTVALPMPFGLAVLAPDAADDVIAAYPEIERWVIGGHSLGGAMAAGYAAGHDIDGLVLWAAYPAADNDLSGKDIAVASIYASDDGLTTADDIVDSVARLPADTTFTEVVGGDHAGFGWYGPQDGDGEATISREQQQEQVVTATLQLIDADESG